MSLPIDFTPSDARSLSGHLNAIATLVNQLVDGTGWRNVSSLLSNGATASRVLIRRKGDVVTLRVRGLKGNSTAAAINWLTGLPSGWAPAYDLYFRVLGARVSTTGNPVTAVTTINDQITVGAGGQLGCPGDLQSSTGADFEISWVANGGFPAPANYPGAGA